MTTIIIIFTILATLAVISQVGVSLLRDKWKKTCSYIGIVLHLLVFPFFPYLGISMAYCLLFYMASTLLRLFAASLVKAKGGDDRDV